SVFGTRPEAIKMAPIVLRLAKMPEVEARVCVTAQHRQMLDQVLDLFQIRPDYDLNLMQEDQTLGELGAAIFTHLEPVLEEFRPDWVLVQGDTTTVAITALLAYYHRLHVGHVEAGLRTHDKWQPFPEEINRRIAGVIADLHFAPTEWARQNLLREGVPEKDILITGNPVIDALHYVAAQPIPQETANLLERAKGRRLILVTAHRRENFGAPLQNICRALQQLAARGDLFIIYPVHLNPNVQSVVRRELEGIENILLLPPLEYLPLVHLMRHATLILTDSGGIQEEAPAFGVPVLVLRNVTERPEGVQAGVLKLVGTETENILRETEHLLEDAQAYQAMARAANPFGDGRAAERIVQALLQRGR
ncbi:MAG: non-hydrolyzing UDP-N-acetylglucosamine 2-epimerase, partial [Anaerolineales bacterium]